MTKIKAKVARVVKVKVKTKEKARKINTTVILSEPKEPVKNKIIEKMMNELIVKVKLKANLANEKKNETVTRHPEQSETKSNDLKTVKTNDKKVNEKIVKETMTHHPETRKIHQNYINEEIKMIMINKYENQVQHDKTTRVAI